MSVISKPYNSSPSACVDDLLHYLLLTFINNTSSFEPIISSSIEITCTSAFLLTLKSLKDFLFFETELNFNACIISIFCFIFYRDLYCMWNSFYYVCWIVF